MAKDSFEPEIIEESPFPGEIAQPMLPSTNPDTKNDHSPSTDREEAFPRKRAAVELLSTALNTRSRKILEEFALTQSGGLKIGDFKQGISGDLRITPNGITARDIAGITTFAIVGSDGSAVFKGEIKSGSLITGEVIVGNNNLIFTVDDDGQPQILLNDGDNDRVLIGYQKGGF